MENPEIETSSLFTPGIKRHVKDKRISKSAKLNVSLASKIKAKIINNSSIFKISLKHNNRALAQALSREKENSRRLTTEKMLLQKEVEKLNFENTFLRLKLNNLNKKLIEIETLMNNNLITAIEMSSLSEFHQSPFLLPASQKKRVSKQCKLTRLPFARVPLTSTDDDDDIKEKMHCDNIIPKTSPDISSSLSNRHTLSTQEKLELLFVKENNQNILDNSEHISSIVDILPKDQSSKNSLMSEMKNVQSISHRKEKPSPSNVTERKKRVSSWESNNPSADVPFVTDLDHQLVSGPDLNWSNEINEHIDEVNINRQIPHCLPASSFEFMTEPNIQDMNKVQSNDDFQLQKTVYDADMDLTAGEISKIITVSTGTKNKSNKKTNDCGLKTFRKVKDSSSEKKRERSKRQFKNTSDEDVKEKIENKPERRSVVLDGKGDLEDPNFIFNTEQLTQVNILREVIPDNSFDQDDRQSIQCNKKRKKYIMNAQEEIYSFSQSSDKFQQESKFDTGQISLTCNKSKASRQTFVIHKLETDNSFPNEKGKEIFSENLEVANESQTADLSTKENGNLFEYETQNTLYLKKHVTDLQHVQQNESKINKKLKQKVNRKTQIISEMNQIYDSDNKDVHSPEKGNFFFQTQKDKETISENLEVSNEFQAPTLHTSDNGNLCDCETQSMLGLQNQLTDMYPVQQNESKVNKKLRQKINQKTEMISEVNHIATDKGVHCPEKADNFFLLTQKDTETISQNLEDPNEFQTPTLSTKDSGNLCDHETQNVLGVKKHAHDMQPACQKESKIEKKLRQKVYRKTEIISETNQIYENDEKGMHDPEKGDFFSLTQRDKKAVSEDLKVTNEFQTADLSTKDNGNLYDCGTQNILGLEKHVTGIQTVQQNESKIGKKLRQKANQKTQLISEMNKIYEDNDKHVHSPENYTKDPDFKINKSKQRTECQSISSGYCMEINSNEKENYDQTSSPYKLVKKHWKESSAKAKNILGKGKKSKPILQLIDSSQASICLESGLKKISNESHFDPGNQIELHTNQKQSIITLNKKMDIPFVEVMKEEKYKVKKVNRMTSKSKKKKTFIDSSPHSCEIMEMLSDVVQGKSVQSEQTDKTKNLENKEIVTIEPDLYAKMFKSLSRIYSPNRQDSSCNTVHESQTPLSKTPIITENFALKNSSVFQVSDDAHKKIRETKFKVSQGTQRSGIGDRTLQDLTNTSFVSNHSPKSENNLENPSSELPNRKRRCTPLYLKEPSLKHKMRR
ncbi:shugoshin 2 isoform X2 [Dasypus novemcinctus]|uniref:shugoshin 2 isoform X2 n=1 Tax=Dasypus novemcinctus TaxID=9361 RepID=UPI00265F4AE4|nr:shugoshin 2 isoform X2 [Dasypus novemcinctus]